MNLSSVASGAGIKDNGRLASGGSAKPVAHETATKRSFAAGDTQWTCATSSPWLVRRCLLYTLCQQRWPLCRGPQSAVHRTAEDSTTLGRGPWVVGLGPRVDSGIASSPSAYLFPYSRAIFRTFQKQKQKQEGDQDSETPDFTSGPRLPAYPDCSQQTPSQYHTILYQYRHIILFPE